MEISIFVFLTIMIGVFVCFPLIINVFVKSLKVRKIYNIVTIISFVIVMLILTLFKVNIDKVVTIDIGFNNNWCSKTIWLFEKFSIKDMIINLVMFTPLGILIWSRDRKFGKNIIFAFVIGMIGGLVIETLQFILPVARTVQLQDIIFNAISCITGMLTIILINRIFHSK